VYRKGKKDQLEKVMGILVNWIVTTLAIILSAYLLSGVTVRNISAALVAAVVLGLINAIVRPILIVLTLPLTILTFGLFIFILNAVLVLFASAIVPGFEVKNFWWALLFSLLFSIISTVIHSIINKE
jgi:putative membrane protein